MITLTIDGIEVTVDRGATILEAAEKAGVRIPTLCHDKRLIPYGACRLCVVELEGRRGRLMPACFNPARNGMAVLTDTPAAVEARKLQLQLLLRHHPLDCPVCEAGGSCQLQNLVHEYGVEDIAFDREPPPFSVDMSSHFIKRDMNRCILCGCCVRICNEVQGVNELSFVSRGIRTEVSPDFGRPLNCEFCGQCVSACPVGALVNKPLGPIARPWEVARTKTTCAFCGLGCALVLETKGGHITRASSQYELGANEGNLCVKGRYGWPYVHSDRRLKRPLVRNGDQLLETSWDEAIQRVAERWKDIRQENGSQALAVLGSARLTNEEAYVLQRLARGVLGTSNVDHAAGQSYRPLLDGIRPLLGYAGATNPTREIREADVILAVGANFKQTHPVAKNQVVLAAGRKGTKVFVVDHVHTSFCDLMGAEAILVRPGTEGLVIRGMLRFVLDEGLWGRAFVGERTEGLEAFREAVAPYDLATVAERTGASVALIQEAAQAFAQAQTGCILMALETLSVGDPVDLAKSLACLALLAGKVGRPGCGLHVYGEKANSQGALDMGLTPDLLPGYGSLDDPEARGVFEDAWSTSLPASPGLDARGIIEGCREGRIRSLYVVGENPLGTYPDRNLVQEAMEGVEFLVVQELFLSETAQSAHVVFPVASFAEREGTFTSADRRIQRVHRAIQPLPGARTDLEVFGALMEAMGCPFPYEGAADILEEIGRTASMYRGVRWDLIPDEGLPWPLVGGETPVGTPILYSDGFPLGKARLELGSWEEDTGGPADADYPWILHPQTLWFHSGTFSTWSRTLMEVCPEPWIVLHAEDAREIGLSKGGKARVISSLGSMEGQVSIRARGPRGLVQVPHHFPNQPLNRLLGWDERVVRVRVEKA